VQLLAKHGVHRHNRQVDPTHSRFRGKWSPWSYCLPGREQLLVQSIRRLANNSYYSEMAIKTENDESSPLKRSREEPSEKSGLKRQKLSHDKSGSIDDHSLQLILAQATAAAQQESAPVLNGEGPYQGHISSPASQQSHPTGGSYEWDAKLQMRISSLPMLESLVRISTNLRSIHTTSQCQSIEKLS
jgi:hypothetical protein